MYRAIGWAIPIFLTSFLFSCTTLLDSDSGEMNELSVDGFSMETDQAVYLIDENDNSLEINYAYVNESNKDFYPGSCVGIPTENLQKLVDGKWILAYTPACQFKLGPPLKINRGDRYEVVIQLPLSMLNSVEQNSFWKGGDIEGFYRVREQVYAEWDTEKYDNNTLQSVIVVSNAFEIRKEP